MIAILVVVVALLVQVTVVNRFPLPPGGGPDLVLLVVIGLALARGPVTGAVIGFCAGILIDVMPPTAHVLGQYAFVYALVGYVAGRRPGGTLVTVMLCVLAAPLLAAAVGWLIGDPRVTAASVTSVVPVTVLYSLLLAPLVIRLIIAGRSERYA
ncbi:rod shape-determining protein MreD [Nonomuraea sp. NPDC003804]|uniref:rod shape-determining protein MreD n=1 Tax=Nonomuraea sp. NPDC003804 TaxID=3154547 RepID=UPI0033AF0CCB